MYSMDLARRDTAIDRVSREIEHQKRLLRERFHGLRQSSKENKLLDDVVDDYERFYHHIRVQKEQQREALHLLSEYLSDVTATSELTGTLLREAKKDQTDTLREMERLRGEIHTLMEPEHSPHHDGGAAPLTTGPSSQI